MLSRTQILPDMTISTSPDSNWNWAGPLFVFSCALALRLIVLFQFKELNPLFDHPVVDAWRYDTLAKGLLRTGSWPEPGAFFQPPAYPLFLAAVYALFGESYTWVRVVQACMGSLSCVFISLSGARLYSRRIGFFAGLIMAGYGPLIFFDLELLAPVLIVFWSTLGLLLLHCGLQQQKKVLLASAGFCLGSALVSWPIVGLFCLCVFIMIGWDYRRSPGQAVSIIIMIGLGLLIPILPVFLHNVMHGEWVLISTNGGINFFIGNNPSWQETVAMRPGYPWEKIVTLPYHIYGAEQVKETGASALYSRDSFNYITAQPFTYVRSQLIKLYQLFFGYEIMRNTDLYFFKQYSPVLDKLIFSTAWLKFPFGLLMPFAAVGIFFSSFSFSPFSSSSVPRRENKYLVAYLSAAALGLILFFVTARYRIILVPVLAIYAALGLGKIKTMMTAITENKKKTLSWAGILLGLLLLGNIDLLNQQRIFTGPIYQAQAPFTLGRINLDQNDPEQALVWLKKSVEIDPLYPDAWVDIGRAQFALGRTDEAIAAMNRAIEVAPDYPLPSFNLALIFDRPSMPKDTAVEYYREFLVKSEAYFETRIRGNKRTAFVQNRINVLTSPTSEKEIQ